MSASTTTIPTPSIGRIVLFMGKDGIERPAVVTHVWTQFCVNLFVFPNTKTDDDHGVRTNVTHIGPETNETPTTGPSWRWMPFQIQTAGTRHQDVPTSTTEQVPVNSALNFSAALSALKAGRKCSRAGWNGKGQFVVLMPALYLPPFNTQDTARKVNDRTAKWIGEDKPLDSQPYFALYTAQGKWQPGWLASQSDLMADDWMVLPD